MNKRILLVLPFLLLSLPAQAAQCGGDFRSFLGAMAADARAAGLSQRTLEQAFAGATTAPARWRSCACRKTWPHARPTPGRTRLGLISHRR